MVRKCLRGFRDKVQIIADGDEEHAETIIVAAGLHVKIITVRVPQEAGAKQGEESGSAIVNGEGKGNHNFQISKDNINFTNLEGNGTSKILVTGLDPGTYFFRSRKVLTKGKVAPWSQSYKLTVV